MRMDKNLRDITLTQWLSQTPSLISQKDVVAVEAPITLSIESVGSFTILAIPSDLEALAVGFAYTEGLIHSIEDVLALQVKDHTITLKIENPDAHDKKRNLIMTSACGLCGTRLIEKQLQEKITQPRTLSLTPSEILSCLEVLRSHQPLFQQTGATHAAAIFSKSQSLSACAEDIGRHVALDKAIGKYLLSCARTKQESIIVALSGRVSFEMVAKACRLPCEILLAISAPSSLAIEAADRFRMTLCGFVRANKINIYTHPHRISSR
jgi:FdhD protein